VHRLVIALTTLLTLTGATVVAGYLLIFAAAPDRAARAVPADAAVYATVYLQPSAGQRMNLGALLGSVPGFADQASLDDKIHEIAQRLLGQSGIDYRADVRPWLGDQLSFAFTPDGSDPASGRAIVLLAVRDRAQADAAMARIVADRDLAITAEDHAGVTVQVGDGFAYALLDDLLVYGDDAAAVEAALDADAGRIDALAGRPDFVAAMGRVPADHLASAYVDLLRVAGAVDPEVQVGGYSTASVALVVEQNGLRLAGTAPFDPAATDDDGRAAFALASEPSSLASWMPADTQLEVVIFGMAQSLAGIEAGMARTPQLSDAADALSQLRAVAAVYLGIDVDADLLPLFDRESALALANLTAQPGGQLLLHPSDPEAAEASLARIEDALRTRGGADVTSEERSGSTITTVSVPQIGSLAYAVSDGVIVVALDADHVAAALDAHATERTLAAEARYHDAWRLAGAQGGNELYVDVADIVDAAGDGLGVDGDERDILLRVGALGITVPATTRESEFRAVLTTR
jgi:hypothetical protein